MTSSVSTTSGLGHLGDAPSQQPKQKPQEGTSASGGKICAVPGCKRTDRMVGGFCNAHYQRLRRSKKGLQPERQIGDKHGHYNPKWRGGVVTKTDGRILVYSPGHPHAHKNGKYVLKYRLEKEQQIGRFLEPEEIIHHPHGLQNPNTQLLPDQSVHARIHNATRKRNPKGQFQGS